MLGIIHHNKSGSTDPLQVIMGSRAFCVAAEQDQYTRCGIPSVRASG